MIPDPNWLFPIAIIQAIFLGFLAPELARESGPKTVKMASIVATAISFILGIVLSTPATLVACAAGYAVLTMLFSYWYGEKIVAAGIRKQFEMAPSVVQFGLRNYSRFAGKDGISPVSLNEAIDEGRFSEDELLLVNHLLRHISEIGHVVDTIVVASPVPMMGGGAHAFAVYAISEQDLRSYQSRLKTQYGAWLKA